VNYPFLGGLLGMFRDSGYLFGRGVFEKRLAASLDILRNRYRDKAHMLTPEVVLGVLYDIGFLGVHRNGAVLYRHRNEDRVEPGDEVFSIHPCFRYALHAEQPTTTVAFEPERLHLDVTFGVQGHYDGGSPFPDAARGTQDSRLLESTRTQATRVLGHLHEAGLPIDVHKTIAASIERIIRSSDELGGDHPGSSVAAAVGHVVEVANFLRQLSVNLERNGFGTSDEALSFIRRAGEAGDRLRRQAEGTERS
jgi:hypothetical protein